MYNKNAQQQQYNDNKIHYPILSNPLQQQYQPPQQQYQSPQQQNQTPQQQQYQPPQQQQYNDYNNQYKPPVQYQFSQQQHDQPSNYYQTIPPKTQQIAKDIKSQRQHRRNMSKMNDVYQQEHEKLDHNTVSNSSNWSCNRCTFDNKPSSQTCGMCGMKNENVSKTRNSIELNIQQLNTSNFEDDKKDQTIIFEALGRMRERGITDTKKFTWQLVYNENANEYINDEKEEKLSQLINVNKKELLMCKFGHGYFRPPEKRGFVTLCVSCGSNKKVEYCWDCKSYDELSNGNDNANESNYFYCHDCRVINGENIKKRVQFSNQKAAIIRKELLNNPCLERDLLCDMERATSVEWLLHDVNKLTVKKRKHWCLLIMDLDNLKAWNTCLGHGKTDALIQQIGKIIKRNINEVNKGQWKDTMNKNGYKNSLHRGFCYRTGGDEFVVAIKRGYARGVHCPLGPFYGNIKREVNALGKQIKELIFDNDEDWKEAQEKLNNATDRKGNKINMSVVGISTGIFIPSNSEAVDSDWLKKADAIALENAKHIYEPKKNEVSIYYEEMGGLIGDNVVPKCLEEGIHGNW